jgi:hypothetical protein
MLQFVAVPLVPFPAVRGGILSFLIPLFRRQESLLRVDLRDNQLSVLSQASLAISEMLTNGKRRFIPVRQ